MRFGCACVVVVAASGAVVVGCADWGPRAEAPRTQTVARDPHEGEAGARAAPTMLVWVRDRQGAAWTYQVQPDGTAGTRLEGVHFTAAGSAWTWVTQTLDVETEPCDLSLGARHPAQVGTVTRATIAGASGREQVVVDPPASCDEHCPNELKHVVQPIATVGPYVFVETSEYTYACGAHGATQTSFLVWDVERGRPVDMVGLLPDPAELRADAARRLAADEQQLGAPFGSAPPAITEIVPVVEGRRLAFDAQLTIDACYACSDGLWSSYTRSVRVRTAPPAVLVPFTTLPASVTTFLGQHPNLSLGGWSEAVVR